MDSIGLKIIGSQNEKYTVIKFIKKKIKKYLLLFDIYSTVLLYKLLKQFIQKWKKVVNLKLKEIKKIEN